MFLKQKSEVSSSAKFKVVAQWFINVKDWFWSFSYIDRFFTKPFHPFSYPKLSSSLKKPQTHTHLQGMTVSSSPLILWKTFLSLLLYTFFAHNLTRSDIFSLRDFQTESGSWYSQLGMLKAMNLNLLDRRQRMRSWVVDLWSSWRQARFSHSIAKSTSKFQNMSPLPLFLSKGWDKIPNTIPWYHTFYISSPQHL